jgi:hypothetical protein
MLLNTAFKSIGSVCNRTPDVACENSLRLLAVCDGGAAAGQVQTCVSHVNQAGLDGLACLPPSFAAMLF